MHNNSEAVALVHRCVGNAATIQHCTFDDPTEVVKVVSFAPFGLGSVICNAIIIISIITNSGLRRRREFRIINALAFADFVEGLATFMGGIYRLFVIYAHLKDTQFTPLQCMLLPQSWMWRWSDTATAMMLLVLSLDRLISVIMPLKYLHFGECYMRLMIGMPYIISLFFAIAAWHYPFHKNGTLSMMCMTREFISSEFYQYSKYTSSLASALSVIVYIPLLIVMRSQLKFISEKISYSQIDRKRKAQLRVTATIALSSLSTLFLDALPRAVGMYGMVEELKAENPTCDSVFMYLFLLSKLNSMLNLFLYYSRHKTMRLAIQRLWHCNKNLRCVINTNSRYASVPLSVR